MSSQQIDLENLSNREIKELWEKRRNEQRKQMGFREAQIRANVDLGVDDDHYIDNFGNAIPGRRPVPKTNDHYIDANGYVRELALGEKAPELSGNGLVDWLNNQDIASDPELRKALGAENLFFEERVKIGDSDVLLAGRLESDGWFVTSRSQDGLSLKFRLARNLTCAEAIEQATGYVETKAGPQFRDLTENERRTCERMAVSNRLNALVFYIQCRLPEDLSDRFLQLGAAGDELAILNFAADEKISEIVEEAVANVYYFNNVRADENFFDWVRAHDDGRTWTLTLLDVLFAKYSVETTLDKLDTQAAPTAEELDQLSDAEIESTLLAARKLRAGR